MLWLHCTCNSQVQCIIWHTCMCPSRRCDIAQGRKAPGRLDTMAVLQHGIEQSMALLGLGADSPATVLVQLCERALVRCAAALQELLLGATSERWHVESVWGLCRANLSEQDIEDSIARRAAARAAKDFAASDAEREFLASKGILIMDGPTGTQWRPGVQDAVLVQN